MGNHRFRLCLVAALAPWCFCACGGPKQEAASGAEAVSAEPAPAAAGGAPLQVEGLLGDIPQHDVERAVQSRNDAIAACYQQALDVSEQIEGALEIAFDVAADGSVASAHLRNGTLGSLDAESCILGVARRIVFPAPRGGSRASVVYPLTLEKPYDDPAPAAVGGAQADAVVRAHAADVDRCLGGATGVQLTVYVGKGGRVISSGATSDALGTAEGAACLASAARAWSFPEPGPDGGKATIVF
jgi:hypothetical protein